MRTIFLTAFLFLVPLVSHSWPVYVDLRAGQEKTVTVAGKKHRIRLEEISYRYEPNHWYRCDEKYGQQHLCEAKVSLLIDGTAVDVYQRAYQPPVTACGLRIYVENTRKWATEAQYAAITDFADDARISLASEGEPWGPQEMLFPVARYRWGSSPYQNTWSSLVPYNTVYYHRGEDFGALPDRLDVRAILDGTVTATPLPDGDGRSNAIIIRHDKDFTYRVSHVNTPHVDQSVLKGALIERGKTIAKTGNTYRRPGAQFRDPHFHINFIFEDKPVSPYPFLVEAYLRDYPDNVVAIAGGYAYTLPGREVGLDASRTILREGHSVASYRWALSDGRVVEGEKATISYALPGLYTEELTVRTAAGEEDRDFIQVRVWGDAPQQEIVYGWAYHTPVRGLRVGGNVRFWNRLANTEGDVTIDFGDGSTPVAIGRELLYQYSASGRYTVTLRATGKHGDPATIKMDVVVE